VTIATLCKLLGPHHSRTAKRIEPLKTAPSEQKQRLQQILLPEGVTYSEENYRPGVTCVLFSGLQTKVINKQGLVALPGIEPGF
jgi:hypothetical protein